MTFRLLAFAAFLFAAFLIVSHGANAAPKLSAADKAWIDTCTNRHVTDRKMEPKASRVYCVCMHEQVENNEDMTQIALERSWPPVHRFCSKKAGWTRENP